MNFLEEKSENKFGALSHRRTCIEKYMYHLNRRGSRESDNKKKEGNRIGYGVRFGGYSGAGIATVI